MPQLHNQFGQITQRQLQRMDSYMFQVSRSDIPGEPEKLQGANRETVDAVLKFYGDKDSQWLSELTHQERPWKEARANIPPGERGDQEITHEAMAEYYGSL